MAWQDLKHEVAQRIERGLREANVLPEVARALLRASVRGLRESQVQARAHKRVPLAIDLRQAVEAAAQTL